MTERPSCHANTWTTIYLNMARATQNCFVPLRCQLITIPSGEVNYYREDCVQAP